MSEYSGAERLWRMQLSIGRLLEILPKSSDAYGFAFDLANLMHQTEACKKCHGRGTHDRRPNCRHSTHDCYVDQCYEQVLCKKCGGVGRVYKALFDAKAEGKEA